MLFSFAVNNILPFSSSQSSSSSFSSFRSRHPLSLPLNPRLHLPKEKHKKRIHGWLTLTVLFTLLNLVIGTIAVTSKRILSDTDDGGDPCMLFHSPSLVLDVSGNNLTGEIPFSINNLTHLTGLFLERNRLFGSLPSISIDSLVDSNVSNNNLNGSIPLTLDRFPEPSFAGNLNLCGTPLPSCSPFFPSPAPSLAAYPGRGSKSSKKLSTAVIIAIAMGGGTLLLLVLLLLLICWAFRWRRARRRRREKAMKGVRAAAAGRLAETGTTSPSKEELGITGGAAEGERNRLVFVGRGGVYSSTWRICCGHLQRCWGRGAWGCRTRRCWRRDDGGGEATQGCGGHEVGVRAPHGNPGQGGSPQFITGESLLLF